MKTKNLMTAFALSAMFAACSQDAELNETIAKNDYSNIPMVEAEFTADFGVESRMATKFGLEVGDKVGLAWLGDGVQITNNNAGQAYQNHPLFCTNAAKKSFKTETMLYVGKYFAYMPYTQGDMAIENIAFSIAEQPLTTDANVLAKQAIYLSTETTVLEKADTNGNVTDGAQKAGMGNNVKLNLALLNNPTTIKFAFKNIDALTGLKIENVEVAMIDINNDATISVVDFKHNGNMENWTESSAATFFTTNSTFSYGAINLKGELAVSSDALTTYALLLPTNNPAGYNALTITLTTNYGTVVAENIEVDNAKLFTNFGQTATVTADVDGSKIKNTAATVKTQTELEEVLAKLVASEQEEEIAITLNPAAKNSDQTFVLTDFTLPEGLKALVTLTTGTNASNGIVFAGTTVIDNELKLASAAEVTGKMTVEYLEDAVTLKGSNVALTVSNGAELINNGVIGSGVKVTTVAADEDEDLAFGKYINNGEDAWYKGTLTNNGEAQWINGTVPTSVTGNYMYAEATTIEGVQAAAAATVKEVRVLDGAVITNHEESVTISNVEVVKFYGNVVFNVTDSYSGVASIITFSSGLYATVTEGASLSIVSDNAVNQLVATKADTKLTVEKNANLYLKNLDLNTLDVINYGSVTAEKVTDVDIQNQTGGTSTVIE